MLGRLSFDLDIGQGGLILAEPAHLAGLLLRICATITEPRAGRIIWFGRDSRKISLENILELRRGIGWVQRNSRLVSNMSIRENITLGLVYHRNITSDQAYEQVRELMLRLGIHKFRDRRPSDVDYRIQRLAVYAREMAKQPRLYVFETPTLDLDQEFEGIMQHIMDLKQRGEAAFLISDDMSGKSQKWVDWILFLGETVNYFCSDEKTPTAAAGAAVSGVGRE